MLGPLVLCLKVHTVRCTTESILDEVSGILRVCIIIISLATNHGDGLKTSKISIFWPFNFKYVLLVMKVITTPSLGKGILSFSSFLGALSSTNI